MAAVKFLLFVAGLSAALAVGFKVAIEYHPITLLAERIETLRPTR